jgi:hypothetical protein
MFLNVETSMSTPPKGIRNTFIEVDYGAKVAFTSQAQPQKYPQVHTAWTQSQGLWKEHPVFHDKTIGDVIAWLRDEDCDV